MNCNDRYIPTSGDPARVHEALTEIGIPFGLKHGGALALDTLRMEAGHPAWGREISAGESPFQVGLERSLSKNKESYTGKGATAVEDKVLRMFRVEGVDGPGRPLLLPGDPICNNVGSGGGGLGGMVGEITSTAWSFCFGQQIAFAHVWKDKKSGSFSVKAPVLNAQPGSDPYKVHALTELTVPPLKAARAE
jgi:glycine cleavage system aminomethyltransferase T